MSCGLAGRNGHIEFPVIPKGASDDDSEELIVGLEPSAW